MLRISLIQSIQSVLEKYPTDCPARQRLIEIKNEEEKPRPDLRGGTRKEARARNVKAYAELIGELMK